MYLFLCTIAFYFGIIFPAHAGGGLIGGIIVNIIVSLALSVIAKALAPKPKSPSQLGGDQGKNRLTTIKEAVAPRETVYGELRKSGVLVHSESTDNNQYLHMVITAASHQVESIPVVFVNAEPIYEDMFNYTLTDISTASYAWTLSGSGTSEYYVRTSGGANPSLSDPYIVRLNGDEYPEGSLGSLAAGEWTYGDNDSLGYSTVYVRMPDSTDPDNAGNTVDMETGNGLINTGGYANYIRIRRHLGSDTQAADPDLVSESGVGWSTAHRLRGIAYVSVRLSFNRDVFPSGIPDITFWVKGKRVTEIRDSAQPTQYTMNPALIIRDYLTTPTDDMGAGFTAAEIDDTYLTATANTCDEEVTTTDISHTVITDGVDTTNDAVTLNETQHIDFQTGDKVDVTSTGTVPTGLGTGLYVVFYKPFISEDVENPAIRFASSYDNAMAGTYIDITGAGSGTITVTKKAEYRYTCSGIVYSDDEPHKALNDMISSMGGRASYVGGVWRIRAAEWEAPTISFDESDIIDTITVQTQHSRRERFNAVKGVIHGPFELGVEYEYPSITNSTYEAQDGGERIWVEHDLPFTTRPHTAMRLAKIELERHRQPITFVANFKLSALQVAPGDTVNISNTRFSWSPKIFEVVEWEFKSIEEENNVLYAVEMTLRETASGVFDWNNGEETTIDLAANTGLPNPRIVAQPVSITLSTQGAEDFQRILVTWNPNVDEFVRSGGHVETQFRETGTSTDLTDGTYKWLLSGSGTNEYYMVNNNSAGSNPFITDPYGLNMFGTARTKGTVGSIAAGRWGYGNNDSLGFDTVYVRMPDNTDPDASANSGSIEAQVFEPAFFVDGNEVQAYISPVQPSPARYDIRIRNVNYLGVKSAWVELLEYLVGSTGGVASRLDYGKVVNDATEDDIDWGLVTDTPATEFIDWGSV
jgi:hypothetical protein